MPAPDVRLFPFISSMKHVVVFALIGSVALCNGICTDCTGFRQVCCGSVCAVGYNCVGRSCRNNLDCSRSRVETCCNNRCVSGSNCLGQSCSSDSDCQDDVESCCKGICTKDDCGLGVDASMIPFIVGPTVVVVAWIAIIVVVYVVHKKTVNRTSPQSPPPENGRHGRQDQQKLSDASAAPALQSNVPYEPPSDQPPLPPPPPYTATPTEGSDGMYAPQTDSFASAQSKTTGIV